MIDPSAVGAAFLADTTPDYDVLALARGLERLLIILAGTLCVVLGWDLFRSGVVTKQSAEFKVWDWKISLHKAGPGVFFALFGAAVLMTSITTTLKFPAGGPKHGGQSATCLDHFEYLGQGDNFDDVIMAINTVAQLGGITRDKVPEREAQRFREVQERLQEFGLELVRVTVGEEAMELHRQHHALLATNPEQIPQEHRATVERVDRLLYDRLPLTQE
jgi:hypothetical protein